MGGTSTDVCLVLDGAPAVTAEHPVAGHPVRLPSVDIHTIGAGGGSIARIDAGGALVVGPESAGAEPGPVGYGRGGERPTVTDANLALGRIPAGSMFGAARDGAPRLDADAARAALGCAGIEPQGVIDVVNASMEQALRHVSVGRGVDPSGLALVAFGGAGPLHACALAEAMGMTTVIVPAAAGVLSAVGLLIAPRHRELARDVAVGGGHRRPRRRARAPRRRRRASCSASSRAASPRRSTAATRGRATICASPTSPASTPRTRA